MNFQEYEDSRKDVYEAFCGVVRATLLAAIEPSEPPYRLQQIQTRSKSPDSLQKKLIDRDLKDSGSIESEIKDLAGCRLIFYHNADVDRFLNSGIIHENFEIDFRESRVHHPPANPTDANDFYMASHYVVTLKPERLALDEYSRFVGLRCEIQVHTVLNHAWAETAHDITYKGPTSTEFGGQQAEAINKKMRSIMEDYLIPAGYEFQNVQHDFERLRQGKELFDRGALEEIQNSQDNNERYDLLERFQEFVLPYYDEPRAVIADIRRTVIDAVARARDTETKPIDNDLWERPGKTAEDVLQKAIEIIDFARHLDFTETFSALSQLYLGERSEEGRGAILEAVEHLARNDIDVWKQVGPQVQLQLMSQIEQLNDDEKDALRPVIRTVCKAALDPAVRGTASTDKTVTFSTGSVLVSDDLVASRSKAIKELKWQFQRTSDARDPL